VNDSWQRLLWVSWTAQLLAIVGFSFVYPFLPLYVQRLGVHDRPSLLLWSGLLYAGTTVALAICAPIWGAVSDRYGRKVMVVRSMFTGAVIIALMIVVQNPQELLALRIAQGIFTGSVAASQALVSAAVPREKLGFCMGMMQMALFAGSSIGPLVGGQLNDHLGYAPTFWIAAFMLAAAAILVTLFVHEDFTPITATHETTGFWRGARRTMADPQVALLILVLCVVQFGGQIIGPVLPVFVQDLLGAGAVDTASTAGIIFAVAGLGSAITSVLTGRFIDRHGHYKLVLCLATAATALVTIPQHYVTNITQLFILRGMVGLTLGSMLAVAGAMISLSTPRERRGSVIGLSAGINAAGMAIGQISGSAIAGAFGIRAIFFFTAAVIGAVSVIVGVGVREPQPSNLDALA